MTTIETHADAAGDRSATGSAVAAFFAGVAAWSTTTDHKRIGRIYLGFGLLGLLATSVVSLLLGIERAGGELFDSGSLLQIFQAQRVGYVFAAVIPIGLGLAIAVVPLQLGARQIAFPRLALTGCYAWIGGLALTLSALGRNGGIGGGDANAVDLFLAGHGLMIIGLLASSGALAATVLTTRAPGMTMRRVPLFAWSALIFSLSLLLSLPVVFGAIVYLFIDHRIGIAANFGGAEGIGNWIGYAFSVPAVIVYSLPAVGIAAELFPVTFKNRQQMRGVTFAGIALVGVAGLAATTQQFVFDVSLDGGQSFGQFLEDLLPFLIFSGLPLLGLVIVMGLGALTAKGSRPKISAPFVFAFLGFGMITLGVLATALHGITDLDLYDPGRFESGNLLTSLEEGATVLVVYGTVMAVIGGVAFWAPKLWGRVLPDKQLLPLMLPALGASVLAGVSLCIAGFLGAPGGVATSDAAVAALLSDSYDGSADLWNWLALVGHGLMALTVVAFGGLMLKTFTGRGQQADVNPYDGHTIEWTAASPAPADNFEYVPTVASPSPVFDMTYEGTRS